MKFKGHQSFYIRQGWLAKGIKQINEKKNFFSAHDIDQAIELGVGANMVNAIRYWLSCVGLMEESKNKGQELTKFCELVQKHDKHHLKIGTKLWFHYNLVKNEENATSWSVFFNSNVFEYDKERFLEDVIDFLKKNEAKIPAEKSIFDDFDCIGHTYCKKEYENEIDFEDIACPLSELGLLKKEKSFLKKITFDIEKIPDFIALAMIIDSNKSEINEGKTEIKISKIENGRNSIGKVLNLGISDVGNLLDRLQNNGFIKVTRTAGLEEIRFTEKCGELDSMKCLEAYYDSTR